MDYNEIKLSQVRKRKVMLLSIVAAVFFHLALFFTFRIQFVLYEEVKVPKIMRVRRVRIPPGSAPGPRSRSAARKRAKPKKMQKMIKKPVKKKIVKKKRINKSKIKIKSKEKIQEEITAKEMEIALDQEVAEMDVLSLINGDELIPGGGNEGTNDGLIGLTYEGDMVYEYEDDEETKVATKFTDDYLGTMATPIVTSKPSTSIEKNFTDIPYPEAIKIRKSNLRSGVSRVYLRLLINEDGEIERVFIRSPKTEADKKKYKIFLDAVIDTVSTWDYDRQKAIVFVDVRFTIE